ncbi:MAG: papain-like cysteine protease family protein [Raoultibacter sp.]
MSRFDDPEDIKRQAQQRLDERRGQALADGKHAARERLKTRTARDASPSTKKQGYVKGGANRSTFASLISEAQKQGSSAFAAAGRALASAPPKKVVVIVVCAVMLLFLFGLVFGGFSTCSQSPEKPPVATAEQETQLTDDPPVEPIVIPDYFDPDLGAALVAAAPTDSDIDWIARHVQDYAFDGPEVQYKTLKLALSEPSALPFVRNFPQSYPAATPSPSNDPVVKGTIPLLQQWDQRWGYTSYSSAPFGLTGCCPTSFSMVYQGLTGKNDMSPAAMGELALRDGYMDEYKGTDGAFLIEEAAGQGLSASNIPLDAESLRACLRAGEAVICNVGPGDFTNDGHFFVIVGLNGDGSLRINDPFSKVRSDTSWDINQIIGQAIALYSFRAV